MHERKRERERGGGSAAWHGNEHQMAMSNDRVRKVAGRAFINVITRQERQQPKRGSAVQWISSFSERHF